MAAHEEENIESFVTFIEKNDKTEIKDLCQQWENLCESLPIDSMIRWKMDPWFQECHRSWKDVLKLTHDVSSEMARSRKEELFARFQHEIEMVVQNEKDPFVRKFKLEPQRDEIYRTYKMNPEMWVELAIQCVEREHELWLAFNTVKQEKEKAEANLKIERMITEARQGKHQFCVFVAKLKNETETLTRCVQVKEEKEEKLRNLDMLRSQKQKNGMSLDNFQLHREIQKCGTDIEKSSYQIGNYQQQVTLELTKLKDHLAQLLVELVSRVREWQREFKLQYSELVASPELDLVAPQCAQTGRLIYDLLNVDMIQCYNTLQNFEGDFTELESLELTIRQLLSSFLQSTFVVTEQESCIIKVDKKHLPKVVVRILGADNFPPHSEEITAEFMNEDDINLCCHDNILDLEKIHHRKKQVTLKSHKLRFVAPGKKDKYEGSFQSLQFKEQFKRQPNQTGKQVHEEKFRILFTTTINNEEYWTMSLPLVVTTGANQGCLSQASVMWQCFSTDVYSVPIQTRNEIPWFEVANMLQAKIRKLCPGKRLSDENIRHLKRRLLRKPDVSDDTLVSLKKFCFDKIEKPDNVEEFLPFSFWKWFIGIYNLLEKYLLNFWKDNLIEGFISKEDAKEGLKRCKNGRSGTFILRFSDQNITDSQGVKSVFGHLTACVLIIKDDADGRKRKKIYDMDVAGHKKLKEKNLANILKETQETKSGKIYQYLYPGEKTREELFDKYCKADAIVPGYTGTRDAFVVDLDQAMAALEISTGKHRRSPSIDSGIDPASPSGSCASAIPKKQRPSTENPMLARILQNGAGQQGHSNFSSPQPSPAPSGSIMSPPGSVMSRPGLVMSPPGSVMSPPGSVMSRPGSVMSPPGSVMSPLVPSPASSVFMSPPHTSSGSMNLPEFVQSVRYPPTAANQQTTDYVSREHGNFEKPQGQIGNTNCATSIYSMGSTGQHHALISDQCGESVILTVGADNSLHPDVLDGCPMIVETDCPGETVIVISDDGDDIRNQQAIPANEQHSDQMLPCTQGTLTSLQNNPEILRLLSAIISQGIPPQTAAELLRVCLIQQSQGHVSQGSQGLVPQEPPILANQEAQGLVTLPEAVSTSCDISTPSFGDVPMDSSSGLNSSRISSGSFGELFSAGELGEVNSGNINIDVFDRFDSSSGGTSGGITSSGGTS